MYVIQVGKHEKKAEKKVIMPYFIMIYIFLFFFKFIYLVFYAKGTFRQKKYNILINVLYCIP